MLPASMVEKNYRAEKKRRMHYYKEDAIYQKVFFFSNFNLIRILNYSTSTLFSVPPVSKLALLLGHIFSYPLYYYLCSRTHKIISIRLVGSARFSVCLESAAIHKQFREKTYFDRHMPNYIKSACLPFALCI